MVAGRFSGWFHAAHGRSKTQYQTTSGTNPTSDHLTPPQYGLIGYASGVTPFFLGLLVRLGARSKVAWGSGAQSLCKLGRRTAAQATNTPHAWALGSAHCTVHSRRGHTAAWHACSRARAHPSPSGPCAAVSGTCPLGRPCASHAPGACVCEHPAPAALCAARALTPRLGPKPSPCHPPLVNRIQDKQKG